MMICGVRMPIVERMDGLLSKKEVAFWFSLVLERDYLIEVSGKIEPMTRDRVRSMMGKVDADSPPSRYRELMLAHHVFSLFKCEAQVITLAQLCREVMPWDDALEFIMAHAPHRHVVEWVMALGPPREGVSTRARAIIKQWFMAQPDTMAVVDMHKLLTMYPHDELIIAHAEALIAQDGKLSDTYASMVMELEDQELALSYIESVSCSRYNAFSSGDVYRFFARYGFEHTDMLVRRIKDIPPSKRRLYDVKPLLHICSPEMVVSMYDFVGDADLRSAIEDYATTDARYALEGLLRLCKRQGKKRDWALSRMCVLIHERAGVAQDLRTLAATHSKGVRALIEQEFFAVEGGDTLVTSDALPRELWDAWMSEVAQVPWPYKAPAWLDLTALPRITVQTQAPWVLPQDVLRGLLAAHQWVYGETSTHEDVHTREQAGSSLQRWVEMCLSVADEATLEAFILASFQAWKDKGPWEDGAWMIAFVCAHECELVVWMLAQCMHERQASGYMNSTRILHALGAMDSSDARYVLLQYSLPGSDRSLSRISLQYINAYRKQHHVNHEQFESHAVPTFGLAADGSYLFDFGTRQVKMIVEGRDSICFVDEQSQRTFQRFPATKKSDDRLMYAHARARYGLLGKALRNVLSAQLTWLELSMLSRRMWQFEVWRDLISGHPVLGHLARRLVWRIHGVPGEQRSNVLLDQSNTFFNVDFEEVCVEEDQRLSIAHPAKMPSEEREGLAQQLAELEVTQPFEQLGRAFYDRSTALEQLHQLHVPLSRAYLADELKRGWVLHPESSSRITTFQAPGQRSFEVVFAGSFRSFSTSKRARANTGEPETTQLVRLCVNNEVIYERETGEFDEHMAMNLSALSFSECIRMLWRATVAAS